MSVLFDGETMDTLKGGALKLIQHRQGYRFSVDPVLLADFVTVVAGDRVIDLGCGGGIIALLIARWHEAQEIVGVEIQPAQVERAQRNVVLNELSAKVQICQDDLRTLTPNSYGLFDRVVSNPPFRAPGAGQCSSGDERAHSRHELAGDLHDFLRIGSALLHRGGTFSMIHLAERAVDIIAGMRAADIEPKRLRMIHSRVGDDARLLLIEGRKGGRPDLKIEPPLYVYNGEDYSAEVMAIYR